MTEFYCFVAAERPSRGDIEFYLASVSRRQHSILSHFGMAKYPSCGDAICLNLTRLAMHRSIRLNSKRLLRAGIASGAALFKILLLNFNPVLRA